MKRKWKELLELPRDAMEGMEIVRVLGNQEIYVLNYEKILCCNPDRIQFLCKKRTIEIKGKHLQIPYYTKDQMQIKGEVVSILFERGGL